MVTRALKIISIGIFMLLLAIPSMAQNTKGDKPVSSRENRFKKTVKKEKPTRRIRTKKRTTTSLRAYRPRKKSRGGERAGRALSPVYTSRPSERQRKNVFPQSGPYVNNSSTKPRATQRRNATTTQRRISARSSSGRTRNVYPQSGGYVNHSSTSDRTPRKKKRVIPRSASRSFIARKSINAWANFPRQKQKRERAYKGDISGRRIRTKNFETKRPAIIQAPAGTARFKSPKTKNVYPSERRFSVPSRKRLSANVYSQRGPYVNNNSRRPRKVQGAVSNRSTLARLNHLQGGPDKRPGKKRKIIPRSASGSYIARRSTNVWAHFPRPKRKEERAHTKDIAGRPLRTKNFETKRPDILINPTARPYKSRKKIGDHPYSGRAGRYSSASRSGRAWKGDITGRKIRGRNYSSKKPGAGQPIMSPLKRRAGLDRIFKGKLRGGGFKSRSGEKRTGISPVPGRAPGIGANGIDRYRGTIRQRKGFGNQGEEYSGNIKSRRSPKGGGSLSGRLWNNRGTAISARPPGAGAKGIGNFRGRTKQAKWLGNQGEEYTGNIKARRPLKGGGSASGRLWNNRGTAIPARVPGVGAKGIGNFRGKTKQAKWLGDQGEEYTGNIKARRPLKGGGSASGRLWNNRGTAIPARVPGVGAKGIGNFRGKTRQTKWLGDQGEEYTGNIKARRPPKGGGSVSGKLWNNRETAIASRPPSRAAAKAGGFPGKIRMFDQSPGFRDQGEEYSGSIKTKRPRKGGGSVSGKLWNNNETPIAPRVPVSDQGGEFKGDLKLNRGYVQNPNAADAALKKRKPMTTYLAEGLQIKVKQRPFGYRKNAPDGALPGLKPAKESMQASQYAKGVRKNWNYVRNPNSSDEALKVREPGKAFARASDFQGNIKMRKFDLFGKKGLHPDAQFMKINKNNVAGEKDAMTNFKLWWSRLFKKSNTQPDHLKYKGGKPRYDKGEQGLWYD
jgi:hypothetical protein